MTSACVNEIKNLRIGFQKLENSSDDDKSSVTSENSHEALPTSIDYLTPGLLEEARTELNETEETRQKCLAEMRKLIEGDAKLRTPTDDLFLLAFLRARKFNVRRAFKLLQNHYSLRKQQSHIFDNPENQFVREIIRRSYMGLLPHRDKKGCVVFVFKAGFWDPDKDCFDDLFLACSGILMYCIGLPATQIAGFRVIVDGRGISWKQLKHFTPSNIMLSVRSSQFCFPARYKGIHVVCESKMIGMIWAIAYPFLTNKLKRRLFFHGEDLSPLKEYIHPSVLPVEFGGCGPCFDNSHWEEIVQNQEPILKELLQYGYRE